MVFEYPVGPLIKAQGEAMIGDGAPARGSCGQGLTQQIGPGLFLGEGLGRKKGLPRCHSQGVGGLEAAL